jgi:hypothetical protein
MSYHQEAANLLDKNKSGLSEFLNLLTNSFDPDRIAVIKLSALNMFGSLTFDYHLIEDEEQLDPNLEKFELILGDLPLNIKKVDSKLYHKGKVNKNWDLLYRALHLLKPGGMAAFIVEPAILFSSKGVKVLRILEKEGYVYQAALNTPAQILAPITEFRPILLLFSTQACEQVFIGEIGINNQLLVANLLSRTTTDNLDTGRLIAKDGFKNFSKHQTDGQFENLKKHLKNYTIYQLSHVVSAVNKTKSRFESLQNCLYVPRVGATQVVADSTGIEEHKHYYQVQLNEDLVLAGYLELFYRSNLGKLILESINSGSFIPHLSKSDLLNSKVAVPSLEEQALLIQTSAKLQDLQQILEKLQTELGLNPKNVSTILEKYDAVLEPLQSLSREDEVLGLIRKGEGKFIEFKQTFSRNLATNKKDTGVEKASLKSIIGFLNAQGGTLLVGVSDSGEVTGIEKDIFNSQDSYLLHFRNAVNSKIGAEFYPIIDYDIIQVMGKKLLKVDCRPSEKPCFYEKKEFFVRTNPATDKLEGQQLLEYINSHF